MPDTIRDLYGHDAHKGRDVGIEIEMEGTNISIGAAGWDAHTDGSLRPNPEAIEWVLHRPYPVKEIPGLLTTLQDTLKANKAKLDPSDRCGVHVHLNCQQLTVSQVLCIICAYLILEEPMVQWCGEDRVGNLFSLRAKDAEDFVNKLMASAHAENFNNFNSEYRYSSINVASLLKFGSLEFRSLRTPKDFSIINTWVNMLMRIKEYAVGFKHPREIIEGVSAGGFTKFPSVVLGDMAELIQCKGIGMMVAEGARRVQEIAYVDLVYKKKAKPSESLGFEAPLPPLTAPSSGSAVLESYQEYVRRSMNLTSPRPPRELYVEPRPPRGGSLGAGQASGGDGATWWDLATTEQINYITGLPPLTTSPIPPEPPRRTREAINADIEAVTLAYSNADNSTMRGNLSDRYIELMSERPS